MNDVKEERATANAIATTDAVDDPVINVPTFRIASYIEPVLPLLAFLEAQGISKRGNMATIYRARDILVAEGPSAPIDFDPKYVSVPSYVVSLREKRTFRQTTEFLRVTSRREKGGVNKKRKLQQYLQTVESLSPLERVPDELVDVIGSYLTARDLSASSLTSKVMRANVLRYIGGMKEYRCTSRPCVVTVFDATTSIPSLRIEKFCQDDVYEAWLLQMTRSLKVLHMQDCKHTDILQYSMRNLTKLETLDVSRSHISLALAKNLVVTCKNLSVVKFFTLTYDPFYVAVAEEFCRSSALVNFGTYSLSNRNDNVVPFRKLALQTTFVRFNRFPELEMVTYVKCNVLNTCSALTTAWFHDRTSLGNIKRIYMDLIPGLLASRGELETFMACIAKFRDMVKTQDVVILILVKQGTTVDPNLRRLFDREPHVKFMRTRKL